MNFGCAERAADGDGAEQRVGSLSERYPLRALELFPHHIIIIIIIYLFIIAMIMIIIVIISSSGE